MPPERKALPRGSPEAPPPPPAQGLGGFARELWRERRLRTRYFAEDLFAEPAWDMLLDLYASAAEGRKLGVRGACRAACVPQTTALRYVNALVDRGLLARREEGSGYGVTVELAPAAWVEMTRLLAEMRCRRDAGGDGGPPGRDTPPPA